MIEDLRNRVWDYLYRSQQPQQVAVIADEVNETSDRILQVVDDRWFDVRDDVVSIARSDR